MDVICLETGDTHTLSLTDPKTGQDFASDFIGLHGGFLEDFRKEGRDCVIDSHDSLMWWIDVLAAYEAAEQRAEEAREAANEEQLKELNDRLYDISCDLEDFAPKMQEVVRGVMGHHFGEITSDDLKDLIENGVWERTQEYEMFEETYESRSSSRLFRYYEAQCISHLKNEKYDIKIIYQEMFQCVDKDKDTFETFEHTEGDTWIVEGVEIYDKYNDEEMASCCMNGINNIRLRNQFEYIDYDKFEGIWEE